MKKIISIMFILFLSACSTISEEEPIENQNEPEDIVEEELPISVKVHKSEFYSKFYSNSVVSVYESKFDVDPLPSSPIKLFESSCYMYPNLYGKYILRVGTNYYTVNEYLEESVNFTVVQLVNYGLPIYCTNNLGDEYVLSSLNTNIAYLQNIELIGTLNGYQLYEQLDSVGCCVYMHVEFITVDDVLYAVKTSTLDREYFIQANGLFYSLEDALHFELIEKQDIFDNKDILLKLSIIDLQPIGSELD